MKVLPPDGDGFTRIDITVGTDAAGRRFDHFVSESLPEHTRSAIIRMIRLGRIKLNDSTAKPGHRLRLQDHITGSLPSDSATDNDELLTEPLDIDILYEDDWFIVINKPPGLVVHPAPGHASGTLVHGLCHRYPEIRLAGPPGRPGIVHRIDKDTSGLLLVAKTEKARLQLSELFRSRHVEKTYLAFVYGNPGNTGRITLPIARHKKDRKKMGIPADPAHGRAADTAWEVVSRFDRICYLRLWIRTGRTHQIRVHCASMGHPIVGDTTYGFKNPSRAMQLDPETAKLARTAKRQMLHAWKITLPHPETGVETTFEAPLAGDMADFHRRLTTSCPAPVFPGCTVFQTNQTS